MFFAKKKEEPANDKLETLKKQLMELKAKEAELDKKAAEKQVQTAVSAPVQPVAQAAVPVAQPVQTAQPVQVAPIPQPQPVVQAAAPVAQPVVQPVQIPQVAPVTQPVARSDQNMEITLMRTMPENIEPATVVRDREIEKFVGNVNGVVLEIGSGMSINVPVKPRMSIDEFIRIAERVKALSALNFEHKY